MKLEKPVIHWNALDVLANQIVGLTIDFVEVDIEYAFNTVKRCYVYKDLTFEKFKEVINFLNEIKLIRLEGNKIIKTRKGLMYYIENLSMIPDEPSYDVYDISTGMKIGILHEEFVVKHGNVGTIFILRGLPWKIEKVEKRKIYVSLEKDFESAIPSWEGELLPVPLEISMRAQDIKRDLMNVLDELKDQKQFFIPDSKKVFIEQYKDWFIIHAPFGNKVNDSLSRIISHIISKKYGIVVGIKTNQNVIILKAGYISKEDIKEILLNINPNDIKKILEEALYNTDLFLYVFSHVAKRFGVIRKDAEYSKSTLRRIAETLYNTVVYEETMNEILIEKMDIENTIRVINMIRNGEISIEVIDNNRLSVLGSLELEEYVSDILLSEKWKEIYRLVKERLENTEMTLVCMACKTKYNIKVKDYEPFKCKKCGGEYFGVAKSEKDLNDEEKLYITADLLKTYGKKFLFVYAGRGISYITASYILRKNVDNEDDLLKEIIEAEKKGIKFSRKK